jgi:hypothetical protein
MLVIDQNGIPTDFYSKDYMDSAVRAGILSICNSNDAPNLLRYVLPNGEFIRGPFTSKAVNYKNFTRDQMLVLVAGLSKTQQGRKAIRKNLWNRIKSFCFAQNTERDEVGSTKYLKPHYFYKDSIPNTITVFDKQDLEYHNVTMEYKSFDCADILMPQHIWHMIKAGKCYPLYLFGLIGITFYLVDLIVHSYSKSFEENQHMAMAYVQGGWAMKLYKLINFNWFMTSTHYWLDRNEIEYHIMLSKLFIEDLK